MRHGADHRVERLFHRYRKADRVSNYGTVKRRILDHLLVRWIGQQLHQIRHVFIPIANLDRPIADRPLPHDDLGAFCITVSPVVDGRFAIRFRVRKMHLSRFINLAHTGRNKG